MGGKLNNEIAAKSRLSLDWNAMAGPQERNALLNATHLRQTEEIVKSEWTKM